MLPKVMIVEDDIVIREVYALKFELEGYPVLPVENGARALEQLTEFKPDFILLDMMMPVMGGLQFMERFKAEEHAGDVIVFSNMSAPKQMRAVMKLGAMAYWVKSDYTPEQVVNTIAQLWEERPKPQRPKTPRPKQRRPKAA